MKSRVTARRWRTQALPRALFWSLVLTVSGVARAEPPPPSGPVATPPDVADLERLHEDTLAARRVLADAVLVDGVAGIVGGGVLMIPDASDQAWRFAGINTAIFGVVNSVVAGVALLGIASEERSWASAEERAARRTPEGLARARIHAILDERRESVAQAANLGLDVAYLAVGGTAMLASQLGVEHPNRWLASGVAIAAQSLILVVIDFVGMTSSARYHAAFLKGFAPSLTVSSTSSGTEARLGLTGRF